MRSLLWALAVLGVFAAPVATAAPLVGVLHNEAPFRVEGVILPLATPSARVLLRLDDHEAALDGRVLDADRVRFELHTWTADRFETRDPLPEGRPETVDVSRATLDLRMARNQPQIFLEHDAAPTSRLEAHVAACDLRNPAVRASQRFPDDASRVSRTTTRPLGPRPDDLVAECAATLTTGRSPAALRFYGFDLWLDSAEEDRLFRTGTFDEADPLTGLPQRVTRILYAVPLDAPPTFRLDRPHRIQLYAPAFSVDGRLATSLPAQGELRWGDQELPSPIESFQARGEFDLSFSEATRTRLQGETLEDPPTAAPAPPVVEPAWIVAGAAAGVGLLAWIVRTLLWPLFSQVQPRDLLRHPRRAAILQFVRQEPGLETAKVARSLGIGISKTFYHVERLRRGGHLLVHRVGGRTALFPANEGYGSAATRHAILRRPTHGRLYELLRISPALDQAQMAGRLGLTHQRVSQVLTDLAKVGLVARGRRGRRWVFLAASGFPPTPK